MCQTQSQAEKVQAFFDQKGHRNADVGNHEVAVQSVVKAAWGLGIVKLSTLALDFDGTIAQNAVLDPKVRKAIAEARAQDVVVLLVTVRILEDLRRVAGDLHLVDAVVSENGAAIYFPDSGYLRVLAEPPPAVLLNELRREGVLFSVGQSIIDPDQATATRLLAMLQRLELPLVLAFNRSRVIVLPQAISKATGLRQALTILRFSPHNAVAIGDAENDHELLHSCEVGVAVAWGSEALKASADHVLPGDGPTAVLGRHLVLGHTDKATCAEFGSHRA
jgi:hydroxymethylpyrimidine pyrophosphatase-like HAD family hydrolase